ncbi:hypothetical protein ACFOEK_08950 [Litoribrevibacter euphylliae]|uniref:Uncharacterized protein n=1 Tax=Litoribrevibacter euphylliae TaxID=1834034 RepID=A0ABV7HBA5_9GAMM
MNIRSIAINLIGDDIPLQKNYRKTSPGKRSADANSLLSFTSLNPGSFSAEGKGKGLEVGETVFVSLKGSKTLSLPLMIKSITYLIEPADHWQAELEGESFGSLNIYTWQVNCDSCQQPYPLEFVSRSDDDSSAQIFHAETRLTALGWLLDNGQHICPVCASKESRESQLH